MPFALTHKASKGKLRRTAPSPLDLTPNTAGSALPTPPPTAEGFKMFWKKKTVEVPAAPKPYYPAEAPRPILRNSPSPTSSPTSIRFAGGVSGPPAITINTQSQPQMPGHPQAQAQHAPQHQQQFPHHAMASRSHSHSPPRTQALSSPTSTRRSSRPASPSASSFGARIRTSQCSISSTSTMTPTSPLSAAPLSGTHITTPPTAYVSTFQERAPPPPSPYRPTSERARASTSFPRPLPELLGEGEMAPRPPRHSSLFVRSDSMRTIAETNVPMLNIIPATPQTNSDEFGAWTPARATRGGALDEAVRIDEMEEIPLDAPVRVQHEVAMPEPVPVQVPNHPALPSIDIDLDFSPFSPLVDLPDTDDNDTTPTPTPTYPGVVLPESLPPSPPFESFPSLPSLSSHASMPSSASDASMPSSSSTSSLVSFPDVEEALGSMLASLSESDLDIDLESSMRNAPRPSHPKIEGLGLGLDLPDGIAMSAPTAPLHPARRRAPPPLDLSRAREAAKPEMSSAPPCINHRVAFYRTAKAAPNSPTSGIFTVEVMDRSPLSVLDLNSWIDETSAATGVGGGMSMGGMAGVSSARDSVSLKSESSDDDLHTASIISLTPMLGDRARVVEMREEVMLPVGEVGLAL